jgi:hypothetical protein
MDFLGGLVRRSLISWSSRTVMSHLRGTGRSVAVAIPAVENLTFRSGRELPRVPVLG